MSKLVLSSFLFALLVAVNGDDVTREAIAILTTRDAYISENITGHIVFTETDDGLRVYGNVTGLPFGRYSLHVHVLGDISTCYTPGAYFNDENLNHGGTNFTVSPIFGAPATAVFEVSDVEGYNGTALVNFTDNNIALRGEKSVLGRTLVLHQLELFEVEESIPDGGAQPPAVQPPAGGEQPPVVQPPAVQPPAGGEQPPVVQPPAGGEQPPAGGVQPPIVGEPPAGGVQPPVGVLPALPPVLLTGEVNPFSRIACGVIAIRSPSDPWLAGSAVTSSPSLLVFIVSMLVTLFCFNK